MIRIYLFTALVLLGFVGTILNSSTTPLPTATLVAQELPTVTPTPGDPPPVEGAARGFDPGAAGGN